MNLFSLSGLLIGIACTAMAGLVYLTNRRSRVNQLWAIFCMAVAIWGFGGLLIGLTDDPQIAFLWWRIAHVGIILIPVLFYHFVTVFLELRRPRSLAIVYLVGLGFLFADATPLFISHMRKVFGQFYYDSPPGPLYPYFFLFFIGAVVFSHLDLWKFLWRTKRGLRRVQVQWFFLATVVGFAGGTTCFLPVFGIDLYPYGNFTVPLYPVIMTYAILRYRLMDVNLAIARGAIFLFIYSLVVGLPFFVGAQLQGLWTSALGTWWWVGPVVLMGILASLGPFVYLWIQQKAEAHLLKEQRHYQTTLMNSAKGMTRIHDLPHLLNLIVRMLTSSMKLAHAAVFLLDMKSQRYVLQASRGWRPTEPPAALEPEDVLVGWLREEQAPLVREEIAQLAHPQRSGTVSLARLEASLKRLAASVVVPSVIEKDRLIGFLVLGEKLSGAMYSQDDLNVLQTLANQAALAIQNAHFYESEKERQAALFHTASLASLGTMASSMGHQVNNRFNVVSVISDTRKAALEKLLEAYGHDLAALRQALEEDLRQFKSLREEAMKGGQIVQAIRKIGRPSTDGYKPLKLSESVQAGLDVVQYRVKVDQVDFLRNLPEALPRIKGDLAQLGECFLNLFANAYDAIQEKSERLNPPAYKGTIHIQARVDLEHGQRVVIVDVSDNGLGMDDKTREGLFVPFFTTKATAEKGTGLGLYVIKKIVEGHGGTITVTSAYGVGTTFTIKLPALPDDVDLR